MKVNLIYQVDLDEPIVPQQLRDGLFYRDKDGHRIVCLLRRNKLPERLQNALMTAYIIRENDQGTVVAQGTVQDDWAGVVLPEAAYAVPGRVSIVIQIDHEGAKLTVLCLHGMVLRTVTDTFVDPGHVIPSLNDLLAHIGRIEQATNAANQAAAQASQAAQTAQEQASVTHGLYLNIKNQLDSGALTGRGLTILGTYGDLPALQNAVTSPAPGDAYAVGGAEPYDIYIWDGVHSQWRDHGRLQGAKGADGLTTSVNGVAHVDGNVQLLAGHIPTADGRNVEQALGECRPELIYSGSWASGQITLQRAAKIYRLLVVVHQHSGAVVPVGQSMHATYRYPWYDGSAWHIVEQLYIISLANTTGQKITMVGSLKYLDGTYAAAADPIEKIYGIR